MLSTQNPLNFTRSWLFDFFSLAIVFISFYAIWIGSHALFTPDEGRYSEVAREMIVTGDFITPRLNGVVFLDKPILYYWLQASAIQLFGLKEWALRFWPAFMGVFGCLASYVTGRLLFNRRTGLIAAVILATSPLYYGAAHYANLDLEVAVFISCSLLFFITAVRPTSSTQQRDSFLVLAYIFAGLAALTKGLIGIAFPGIIIGLWILLLNRWTILIKMRLVSGLLLFVIITAPWYILVQKANPEFFQFFFMKQQVSRFLTTDHFNNRTPGWFYLPIMLAGFFPWSVFFANTLIQQIKTIWKNKQNHASELFLLIWVVFVFAFFSIPKSKTVGYILPIFPALALLTANYLDKIWDKAKTKMFYFEIGIYLTLCIIIATACALLPQTQLVQITPSLLPYLRICATIFAISGGVVLYLLRKKSLPAVFFGLTAFAVAFLLLITASSSAINHKTIKPLAMSLKQHLTPTDEVVAFQKYYQDLPIYLERRITIVTDWNAPDIAKRDNWTRELWYGMSFQDTKAWLIDEKTFFTRWNSEKRLFVFTDVDGYENLKNHVKTHKLAQYNKVILLSNQSISLQQDKV